MVNQVKSLVQQALQAPDGISTNDPHTDIVELDSIITYVEDLRLKLLSKRAAFRSAINEIDSPIIRFLPPEILSRVFTLCSIDFVLFEEEDEQHRVTPLFFGSVCRRWREVAWSTPELWTYIPVHLTSQNFDITRVIQICSQWLDRSGELPLNIRISFDAEANYSVSEIQEGVDSLIATLLHYSRRWRYLDIRTPFSLHLVHDECPLEYLCIDLRSNASRYTLPPSSMNCQCLPNLRKLYLSSVSLDHLHIQWDNITHIKLASPFHIFDCQNIFQRCPKLVYCSFPSVITKGRSDILGTVRLLSLKFLELGHSDHEWYSTNSPVPSNLELPALEELRYRYLNSPSETRSLLSLLERSSSRLQSLVLDSTQVTWDDLGPLLKLLLDLKKLSFKTRFFYYALFTELSRTAEGFLPNLEILDYATLETTHAPWPTLASLLEDICSSSTLPGPQNIPSVTPQPLKAIALTMCSPEGPDAQSIPKFMNILGKGFYLDLQHIIVEDKRIASNDLLERAIKRHCPSELDRYVALRTQRRDRCQSYFSQPDYWSM